jgi:hypothetical protein
VTKPRSRPISLRLSDEEREIVEWAAEATCPGLPPSTWIRAAVLEAAKQLRAEKAKRESWRVECRACGQATDVTADKGAPRETIESMARRAMQVPPGRPAALACIHMGEMIIGVRLRSVGEKARKETRE